MNRLTLTRRAALTSLALVPILAACGSNDTTPHVDPSASSYGTLRIGYGALREMRAVAHVYARALRQIGYSVELVDTDNSRATALRGLMVPSANSATPTATLPDDEATGSTTAAALESLDLVIDYSGDLLLYLTDDGKISPAAAQNERIAASVSASAQAAGVTLPPAATPTTEESTASAHATDGTASPSASSTRSADPINLRAMSTTDMTNAISRILPEELIIAGLNDWAQRPKKDNDKLIFEAYAHGDFARIPALLQKDTEFNPESSLSPAQQQQFADWFVQQMIVARNRNWLPKIQAEAAKQPTLFAVGTAHLVGNQGLIMLLRNNGYQVEPMPKLAVWQ